MAGDYEEPGKGHNGFFTERDTTFIVYHAYTRSAEGAPLLNIKPMYIDEEGWPTLDSSKKILVVGKKRILKEDQSGKNKL